MGSVWLGEAENYYLFTVLSMSVSVFSIVGKLSVFFGEIDVRRTLVKAMELHGGMV